MANQSGPLKKLGDLGGDKQPVPWWLLLDKAPAFEKTSDLGGGVLPFSNPPEPLVS